MSDVIRLTFGHQGDQVTLISRKRVKMTLPDQHPTSDDALPHAFVAEVRGSDDRVLHRTAIANPLASHREVFSQEPGRSISRVPVAEPDGAFTVTVPDTPDADHVALLADGPRRDGAGSTVLASLDDRPREIARFSLRGSKAAKGTPA